MSGVQETPGERRRFLDWRKAFISKEAAAQLKQAAKVAGVPMDKVLQAAIEWYLRATETGEAALIQGGMTRPDEPARLRTGRRE